MPPKVSVIVPCYGVEKYLDRCMDSLLNQSLRDIEIILVDDESPDNVPRMCDAYARKDNRVKVIHKKNGGLGYARNTGLEAATGQYVAFVDSDDYVSTEMYQNLYENSANGTVDAVFCGFYVEGQPGVWRQSEEVATHTEWKDNDINEFLLDMVASDPTIALERRYYMSVWHAIYKRDIIETHHLRFLSERIVVSEDIPFQVDFLSRSKIVRYIPFNGYYYCTNGQSLSASFKIEKFERFKTLYRTLFERLDFIPDSKIRVKRLFIGYVRSHIYQLLASDEVNDKKNVLSDIVNDPIWREIRDGFSPGMFGRRDHRLMYWMILNKQSNMLIAMSKMINAIRKKQGAR